MREELDNAVASVLDFDPEDLAIARRELSREPSVTGARARTAQIMDQARLKARRVRTPTTAPSPVAQDPT